MVKADAYGLGLAEVAPALWRAGARSFFVAHLKEGIALRGLLPGAAIYILNGLLPQAAPAYAAHGLQPVLGSAPEIAEWHAFCRAHGPLPAVLHVDTGMHRLGVSPEAAAGIAEALPALGFPLSLVMTHLACADTPGHPLTARQQALFADVAGRFAGVRASLANSAGTLMGPDFRFDLMRPGILLYGGVGIVGVPALRPVVRLDARIIQVAEAPAGETVGYGAAQRLKRDSRLATVHLGYADGLFRAAGATDERAGAFAMVAGRPCPLVGRISMDLASLDITDLPDGAVGRGDFATFLGEGIGVDDLARAAGTIGYEVLTSLGRRYARRYVGG